MTVKYATGKRIVSAEMELALSRYTTGSEQVPAPSEVLFDRLGFRADGSRVYLDRGAHQDVFPEIAFPECDSVLDLIGRIQRVRWKELAGRLEEAGTEYFVDFVSTLGIGHTPGQPKTALGLHENYLTFLPIESLAHQLAAFFATRALVAGGGGIDPDQPFSSEGPNFILSPRSLVTTQLIAPESLGRRPFVKSSREHHSGPHNEAVPCRRLQVIGGDPLMTEVGMLLQFGTTLAMVRLAEALALPPALLRYDLRRFGVDLEGTNHQFHRYRLQGLVDECSALECQFLCLEACEAQRDTLFASTEDRLILSYWREVLEKLQADGVFSLSGLTDYGTKFNLLSEFCAEAQVPDNADGAMHLFSLVLALSRIGGRAEDTLALIFSPFETDALAQRLVSDESLASAQAAPENTRASARARLIQDTQISVSLSELNGVATALFLNWDGIYQKSISLISPLAIFPDPRETYTKEVDLFLKNLREISAKALWRSHSAL